MKTEKYNQKRAAMQRGWRWGALFLLSGWGALPAWGQSLAETLEAIQHARVVTRILYVTAHPDDECASVMPYLARGLGADVALLSVTRGEGGQNALGPEQGARLGVLRTEELLAATRTYGVRLYFGEAPDFGYSKTSEETLRIWGHAALENIVRVIRAFRPHIVINNWGGARAGHGHHQAAGLLTPRAFEAAADPAQFPEHGARGLKPWRSRYLLQSARGEIPGRFQVPTDQVSPLWGKTYNEISAEGCAQHRTQGVAGARNSPFFHGARQLAVTQGSDFTPARFAASLSSLGESYFVLKPAQADLKKAEDSLASAESAAERMEWGQATSALAGTGELLARVVERLSPAKTAAGAEDALWEIEQVRRRVEKALVGVAAFVLSARADRSEVVAGESFTVRVAWQRREQVGLEIEAPALLVPPGWKATSEPADAGGARFSVAVPFGTAAVVSPFGGEEPWPRPLVQALVRARVGGYVFEIVAPVEAVRASSTRVDTVPLALVPAVTLALEPRQFVLLAKRPAKPLELLARVRHYGASATEVTVGIEAPAGWKISPPQTLKFAGPGDQLARFVVTPPARLGAGRTVLKAVARRGGEEFRTALEPLHSLPTRMWSEAAEVSVHVLDAALPQGLRVGYVAAENDPIPDVLRQIGVRVELLDEVALAFGDLKRFDAIAIGIRAYELRADLARANQRLLDYAAAGGTLVVQYQRENVWNSLKPAPYPALVAAPLRVTEELAGAPARNLTGRISDENSPVRFIIRGHPVLTKPNQITETDFQGWVQERGLYFWGQFDARYQPLLGMRDRGEEETTGGLVYARHGKGVYIYTGLSFFRQLPEGVPGAFRLFVNLLSQSRLRMSGGAI